MYFQFKLNKDNDGIVDSLYKFRLIIYCLFGSTITIQFNVKKSISK
jgi:hypothetical protein